MTREDIETLFYRIEWDEHTLDGEPSNYVDLLCPYCVGEGEETRRYHEWWCKLAEYMRGIGLTPRQGRRGKEGDEWKFEPDGVSQPPSTKPVEPKT